MNCHNHPLRQGVNTCSRCGHWLCDECSKEYNGRIECQACFVGGARRVGSTRHDGRGIPNAFLLLLFSSLPGANYMYMGLIKRGLFVMTTFFLSMYMANLFTFFGFVIAGVMITSFFDGLRIRRKFIAGESVSDDINDLKTFYGANRMPILGLLVVLVVIEILQNATRWVYLGSSRLGMFYGGGIQQGVVAIAAIALGIYLLSKVRKRRAPEDREKDLQ